MAGHELPPLPERLPAATTDAHTHALSTLEYSGLAVADALAMARSVNVTRIVEVGTDVESSLAAVALARAVPAGGGRRRHPSQRRGPARRPAAG